MAEVSNYIELQQGLMGAPKKWLITGVAGFIGSNILENLLHLDQFVVGLDNLSTGHIRNLIEVQERVSAKQWSNFKFIEGDICQIKDCENALVGADYVLHQAALGSVPRSLNDPITTNSVNVSGFLNILVQARNSNVKRFVYAASSATYGDHTALPKVECTIGRPLSPYAVTKYVNELYADVFSKNYPINTIGLRYFNVFGNRQDPTGAYAAVIPKWISAIINNKDVIMNGDGSTSRDFCYVDNVVQANILAAITNDPRALNQVYNIAVGERTSLNDLFLLLQKNLLQHGIAFNKNLVKRGFREGDVLHSLADISKARQLLGYDPSYNIEAGIKKSLSWYIEFFKNLDSNSNC